jgi:putative MATE family efflux protein
MLALMGASDSVIETGTGFAAVLLGGSASIIYLFLLNAAFRGAGDASVALRSLWLANGINIVLDPCLIFGLGPFPEMGVTGAAVATTIGRGIGVIYQLWYLFDGGGRLRFRLRNLALAPRVLARLLVISTGGVGQFLIATSSWIIIMRIVALYGSTAVAAYTIGLRIFEFIWLPSWGLGNAAATLVGQNLGAGKPDRAVVSTWRASKYNTIFMMLIGVVLVALAPAIAGFFTSDPDVLRYGTSCLRILAVGIPMYAVGMIVTQALNGAGRARRRVLGNRRLRDPRHGAGGYLLSSWQVAAPGRLTSDRIVQYHAPDHAECTPHRNSQRDNLARQHVRVRATRPDHRAA